MGLRQAVAAKVGEVTEMFTVAEAAYILRVSPRTLEREISAGRLAVVRVRRSRRIEPEELRRYIATGRQVACRSENVETSGRSGSHSAVADALNDLCQVVLLDMTRARSKRGSSGRGSRLRLVTPTTPSPTRSTDGKLTRSG